MGPVTRQRVVPDVQLDGISPVLQRIYSARGIEDVQQLEVGLDQLLPVNGLLNIDLAAQRLAEAIEKQQRVLIVGDYDADGATSCAVAIRALRAFGLQQVDYLVPNRFEYGYGLSPEIVEVARQSRPDLIITVDNGIASIAGVENARQAGIDVLITDHHLPGNELPDANVIVNPNQPGDEFQSKALAGVGVVFYIMLALRALLRDQGWFAGQGINEPNLAELLDIVALGTVADVVSLDRNNRILVEQGLRRLRASRGHAGINALIRIAKREAAFLKSSDLGFAIAPRLNAAGRLEDMSIGIECLLTDDDEHAMMLATQLDEINLQRRAISQDMEDEAATMLEALHLADTDENQPLVYCLHQPHWHQGVIGILAGRIKERTHRPAIVFATGENGELKGSARSIAGFHIRDALDAVASANPGLITRFGGHAMAAGLSLSAKDLRTFSVRMHAYAESVLDESLLQNTVLTDGGLHEDEFSMQTARLIEQAGPWGQGFPEPIFEGRFTVLERRRIGADRRHLKCRLLTGDTEIDAVAFNQTDDDWPENCENVSVTYRIEVNRFRGFETLQLMVQDVLHAQPAA
ncbi:MAG: single-stranded-DNA-specific exonuclease RecJ [Gammaproteobacteria bacterium]|nr:single-stranded-DNA-specific exonuclease RecJ [Gammaproteobacteria bacterium]